MINSTLLIEILLKGELKAGFTQCPVCEALMFICPMHGKVHAYCNCGFKLRGEKEIQNLRNLVQQLGIIDDPGCVVQISTLSEREVAKFVDNKILLNKFYIDVVNNLEIDFEFDRVFFWVYVLAHEFAHALVEKRFHTGITRLEEALQEFKKIASEVIDAPYEILWLRKHAKILTSDVKTLVREQENRITCHLEEVLSSRYRLIYRGFQDVLKRLKTAHVIKFQNYLLRQNEEIKYERSY
jgi:hypothetical protein